MNYSAAVCFCPFMHSPHAADFELAQLQEKLRETELVMENIVSNAHHSPDRWVDAFNHVIIRLLPLLNDGCCGLELLFQFVGS